MIRTMLGPDPAFVLRIEPLFGVSPVPASIGGMAEAKRVAA